MRKIKDFFYNKNDIIIVLIILAVAAFIIYTRIGALMDYPEKLAREAAATQTEKTTESTSETETISVTIEDSDTAATVSQKLEEAGLIAAAADFEEYITSSDKASSLKVGTFQIPVSSLQEEILDIITD